MSQQRRTDATPEGFGGGRFDDSTLALLGGPRAVAIGGAVTWPIVTPGVQARVARALQSGELAYSEHSVCRKFEEAFAAHHEQPYCVATNSGTSALWLAYFACGLGPRAGGGSRDEVLVPAWGFFATASPLLHLGARPVFCDVEPETGNVDPACLAARITPQTRAIVVTHVAGHVAKMTEICAIARRHSLRVIEDCSHAHGSRRDGRLAGTFGDVAAFSLQTGKMIAAGEGGVVLTADHELFRRAAIMGNFRRLQGTSTTLPSDLEQTGLGLKLRLSPLSAALAHAHLEALEQRIEQRRLRLARLSEHLAEIPGIAPPHTEPGCSRGAFYEYPARVDDTVLARVTKGALEGALEAEGAVLRSSNTQAISSLPILYARYGEALQMALAENNLDRELLHSRMEAMPVAESLGRSVITFPTFTDEPLEWVDAYGAATRKVFSQIAALESMDRGA